MVYFSQEDEMFKDLRLSLDLTQQDLADLTGRTRNYIIKAEQCTFPTPPVALIRVYEEGGTLEQSKSQHQYQHQQASYGTGSPLLTLNGPGTLNSGSPPVGLLTRPWRGIPKEILESAYYDEQRRIRREWLYRWHPRAIDTSNRSFKHKWVNVLNPAIPLTEYEVSRGLAVPAAAVFKAEKDGVVSKAISDAVEYLIDYVSSGEYTGKYTGISNQGTINQVYDGLLRIRREIG
jgi:transcriptional regulator with XRE-family HTH domain